MYKALKISTVVIMAILFVSVVVALLLQTFISFMAYPIGALFLYYSAILLLIALLKEKFHKKALSVIVWTLVLAPIAWLLSAPESLINLLMPKLNIDMR